MIYLLTLVITSWPKRHRCSGNHSATHVTIYQKYISNSITTKLSSTVPLDSEIMFLDFPLWRAAFPDSLRRDNCVFKQLSVGSSAYTNAFQLPHQGVTGMWSLQPDFLWAGWLTSIRLRMSTKHGRHGQGVTLWQQLISVLSQMWIWNQVFHFL